VIYLKKRLKVVFVLLVLLTTSVLFFACRAAEKPNPPANDRDEVEFQDQREEIEPRQDNAYQYIARAETIADSIVDLTGVDNATVLISGTTAIVGVDVSEGTEGVISNDLRNDVENVVRRTDTEIREVRITADRDLFNRIDEIEQSLMNGENANSFTKDIESIMNKIGDRNQ